MRKQNMGKIIVSDHQIIRIRRAEPNFDRACDAAYLSALSWFGINEDGHALDKRFDRSTSCLKVKFVRYLQTGSMGGQEAIYEFDTWMENNNEE